MRTTAAALGLILAGCGLAGGGGDKPDGGNGDGGNGGSDDSGYTGYCSEPAKLVWTLEANKRIAKFDPSTGAFTNVGYLNCPGSSAFFQPFSMGLDRNAVAWVLYRDQSNPMVAPVLFRVDTNTLECTATTWTTQYGIKVFGTAFSTETEGGFDDKLFIAGGSDVTSSTTTLATLSTSTISATVVGSLSGWAELSGTSKAELWAYFPMGTARLERLNKATGATLQTFNLATPAGSPDAWAFAEWGGDHWVFLKRDSDPATVIYRVNGTSGVITDSINTNSVGIPRTIIGAGVSTCAPVILL